MLSYFDETHHYTEYADGIARELEVFFHALLKRECAKGYSPNEIELLAARAASMATCERLAGWGPQD